MLRDWHLSQRLRKALLLELRCQQRVEDEAEEA
jgi:hypothetical protein